MAAIAQSDFLENVKGNQADEVRKAVREDASLANARDASGVSALMVAIYRGHRELAEWLADNGASVNFFEACALGRPALVKELVEREPDLSSAYSPDGFQGVGLACFFGHAGVVEVLLKAGANPNSASRNPMKVAPIHSAAANRDANTGLQIVRMLLDHGAEVNIAQQGGWTPLQQAAAHGNVELVRLLLDHGADKNSRAENGKTALDLATDGKHTQTVAALQG